MSAVMCDKRTSAKMKEREREREKMLVRPRIMFGLVTEALGRRQEAKLEEEDMKMVKVTLPGTRMEPGKPDQQSLGTFTMERWPCSTFVGKRKPSTVCPHINSKHVWCEPLLIKPLCNEQPQDYWLVML